MKSCAQCGALIVRRGSRDTDRDWAARRFCSRACTSEGRTVPWTQERVLQSVLKDPSGCWLWLGRVGAGGYGQTTVGTKHVQAHRLVYGLFIGPIPEGLQVDHVCHNLDLTCSGKCKHRQCVNPDHLEAVTQVVNLRRAFHSKPFCKNGHPQTEESTWLASNGRKRCRVCHKANQSAYRARRAARAVA